MKKPQVLFLFTETTNYSSLMFAEQRLHKNRSWAWSETVQNHKQDIMAANQELCEQKFNSK